jgi:hypothetical protein
MMDAADLSIYSIFEKVMKREGIGRSSIIICFRSAREKYERSAEAVEDSVGRLKKIGIDRYAKPIRKRWKAWTL